MWRRGIIVDAVVYAVVIVVRNFKIAVWRAPAVVAGEGVSGYGVVCGYPIVVPTSRFPSMARRWSHLHPRSLRLRLPDDVEGRRQDAVELSGAPAALFVEIVMMVDMAARTFDLGAEEPQSPFLQLGPLGPFIFAVEGLRETDPALPSLDPSLGCAGTGDDSVVRE